VALGQKESKVNQAKPSPSLEPERYHVEVKRGNEENGERTKISSQHLNA
jgi:hypothetical protein